MLWEYGRDRCGWRRVNEGKWEESRWGCRFYRVLEVGDYMFWFMFGILYLLIEFIFIFKCFVMDGKLYDRFIDRLL